EPPPRPEPPPPRRESPPPPREAGAREPGSPPGKAIPAGFGRAEAERGRRLFVEGCSSCHGFDARGIRGRAPSLRGAGAASADFYLRTGRMPLEDPRDQPLRTVPPYNREQIRALVAYVGSFGGPQIPEVHPERGDLSVGLQLFTESCAGCHQGMAEGGITTKGIAPDLQASEPIDVAEAVRVGPYVMPHFPPKDIDQHELDSITRYVVWTREPPDFGGWGVGHIGPIPEGMISWMLAGASLLLVCRLIGERTGE
nr:cytochrome c [Actinomycetota bacterium]